MTLDYWKLLGRIQELGNDISEIVGRYTKAKVWHQAHGIPSEDYIQKTARSLAEHVAHMEDLKRAVKKMEDDARGGKK